MKGGPLKFTRNMVRFISNILNIEDMIAAKEREAMFSAIHNGDTVTVKSLLDNGADVTAQKNKAIIDAVYYGHTEIVKLLLDNGADANARDTPPDDDQDLLCWAAYMGHTEIVKLLIAHGADVTVHDGDVIRCAAEKGYIDIVKLLLDVVTDVSARSRALKTAALYGQTNVVRLLLENGADAAYHNNSAICLAVEFNRFRVIAELIRVPGQKEFLIEKYPDVWEELKSLRFDAISFFDTFNKLGIPEELSADIMLQSENPVVFAFQNGYRNSLYTKALNIPRLAKGIHEDNDVEMHDLSSNNIRPSSSSSDGDEHGPKYKKIKPNDYETDEQGYCGSCTTL